MEWNEATQENDTRKRTSQLMLIFPYNITHNEPIYRTISEMSTE